MERQLLIAGGSGLIGSALKEAAIDLGWNVTLLSRHDGHSKIVWNPKDGHISISKPIHFDAIVNLAGASIAGGRWTENRKVEIRESRVKSSQTIEDYLRQGLLTTNVYVGISGVGIYGDRGIEKVDENTPIRSEDDWMIATVVAWEASHQKMEDLAIRTVILRTGIVLSKKGGALKEMMRTAPIGVFGYFGNGRQIWSWIHIADHIDIIMKAINDQQMKGIYLASSPHSVPVKEISKRLSKEYVPHLNLIAIPIPQFILSIFLGAMSEMLFQSCNAYPSRLLNEGYHFRFSMIAGAIKDLIKNE